MKTKTDALSLEHDDFKYGPGILVGLQVSGLEKDQKYRFGVHLHRIDGRCY